VVFVIWDGIIILDEWFSIPAGGLHGFRSYPNKHPRINTPMISHIICPIALLAGAVVGVVIGKVITRNKEQPTDS
jgi:hypothetical protein